MTRAYGQVNLAAKREAMEAVGDLFEGPEGRSGVTVLGRFRPRSQFAATETQNRWSSEGRPAVSLSAPVGIRTPNLLIRSQMLYPLSYRRPSRGLHENSGPPR